MIKIDHLHFGAEGSFGLANQRLDVILINLNFISNIFDVVDSNFASHIVTSGHTD
jgi:hypothetical protein